MKKETVQKIISENIKHLILEAGITQAELAKALGINESTVGKWLLGKAIPRMVTIEKLADYFNVPKTHILEQRDKILQTSKAPQKKEIPLLNKIQEKDSASFSKNIKGYELVEDFSIDYALIVSENSMINARIYENDILYVAANAPIENGDIVVASVNKHPGSVFRFYQYGDKVILKPENPTMKEQEYLISQVTVLGKVKSAIIKF